MITEPTLEHYVYYLRRVEGDDAQAIQARRAALEKELQALLAHLKRLSDQPIPPWEWPQESEDPYISQRIVRTGWLDNHGTGCSCFVEARTYGDVYWVQVGYCQKGETKPEIFASLRDEAWIPCATDHLLGSSTYLCGIIPDQAMDEMAAQLLKTHADDSILSTHLTGNRARLYGSRAHPYVSALLYPDEKCEDWAGRIILNDIALRLELYRHKADRQLAWCEENYPLLSEQERSLRDLLKEVDRPSLADPEVLRRLFQLYRVFNGNAGMLTERQVTISINLENLDFVRKELGTLIEDRLLATARDHLRRRQRQLEANLAFIGQFQQQAERDIDVLRTELALDRLLDLQIGPGDAVPIEQTGWPGTPPPVESEIPPLTPHAPPPQPLVLRILQFIKQFLKSLAIQIKPSPPVAFPRITPSFDISLKALEKNLLQHIYRGFSEVLIEKEFRGGYGGARVLLTLPITSTTTGDLRAARKVTKLGPALELRQERDNYAQHVRDYLPFCVAQVEGERYYEQGSQAGLNYMFVGGGALGQVVDLEEYYRQASPDAVERVTETLDNLLHKELGRHWYGQTAGLFCFFAAEYSQHLVEYLRLEGRIYALGEKPEKSSDGYQRVEVNAIPDEYAAIQPGRRLSVEGMVVKRIKSNRVELQDPGGRGIIVGVEFAPESQAAQGLKVGSIVGVRGQVVYNRRGRMEQIVRAVFPDLPVEIDGESVELPNSPGAYPNPLQLYPRLLNKMLEGRQAYVHGDLHLRNVLVDGWGKAWLIDFDQVEQRHNLFDFISLEAYVRTVELANVEPPLALDDYIRFEQALNDAILEKAGVTCPDNHDLRFAYRVLLTIRKIAQKYMGPQPDFRNEYFPALLFYCLGMLKKNWNDDPQPIRLAFATACVLGQYILGAEVAEARPTPSVTQRAQKIPESTYNTAAIRQLLTAAFDDEGLTRFCHDHFREAFEEFSTGMSKGQKVHRLLDYCERHCLLEELLGLVEQYNPAQYAHWENRLTNEH